MKTQSLVYALLICLVGLMACDKEDGPVANTQTPGAPSITAPSTGNSYELNRDQPEDTLMTIEWTEPDFGFSSAPTYTVELDVAGNSFESPIQVAQQQSTTYSVVTSRLNNMLLAAGLAGGTMHDLQLRVTASISDSVSKAVSSPISLAITPYQTEFPPIYMIGAAVGGWSLDLAVTVPSTETNVYANLAEFTQDEAFRFFAEPDWEAENWNYPYFADNGGDIDELLVNANDGDLNFQFTGSTGWYRVTVNMETYSVQLEEVEEPIMYMSGAAIGGWDPPGTGASLEMTFIQEGVFQATADFVSGESFRFFPQADWSPSYNYPYFADGTVDELLEDAQDGDNNFRFTGESGSYTITVNLNDLSVQMEAN